MSYEVSNLRCAICRESVNLTESKTDEYGRAVHEECYVSALLAKKTKRFTERLSPIRSLLLRWSGPFAA